MKLVPFAVPLEAMALSCQSAVQNMRDDEMHSLLTIEEWNRI